MAAACSSPDVTMLATVLCWLPNGDRIALRLLTPGACVAEDAAAKGADVGDCIDRGVVIVGIDRLACSPVAVAVPPAAIVVEALPAAAPYRPPAGDDSEIDDDLCAGVAPPIAPGCNGDRNGTDDAPPAANARLAGSDDEDPHDATGVCDDAAGGGGGGCDRPDGESFSSSTMLCDRDAYGGLPVPLVCNMLLDTAFLRLRNAVVAAVAAAPTFDALWPCVSSRAPSLGGPDTAAPADVCDADCGGD